MVINTFISTGTTCIQDFLWDNAMYFFKNNYALISYINNALILVIFRYIGASSTFLKIFLNTLGVYIPTPVMQSSTNHAHGMVTHTHTGAVPIHFIFY